MMRICLDGPRVIILFVRRRNIVTGEREFWDMETGKRIDGRKAGVWEGLLRGCWGVC